jgi:DMSO/TMAO reductase YedYZ molybdopterin-dependent catalytic subunit
VVERVPPGQIVTHGWPVLHAGSVPTDLTPQTWSLELHGEVDRPQRWTFSDLLLLPQKEIDCDVHCVTSWTKLGMHWGGVPFRAVVEAAQVRPLARFVVLECEQGFTTSLPLEVLLDDDVLLAHSVSGAPLPSEHGGPVRMLVPQRYFYKSAKWLRGLRFVREDEPGFWETRGYSNVADPWLQTRYTTDDRQAIFRMRKASLFHRLPPKDGLSP